MAVLVTRRYDRARFYKFDESVEDFDAMDSPFHNDLITLRSVGYVDVTAENVTKLDLLAKDVYGDDELWWVLADFNYIMNPHHLTVGQRLFYPALDDLEAVLFENTSSLNDFSEV
tara:strand:+ start:219 stop:563 length:345 start_codon:yes stop_codon:yes gene_type:complete